MIKRIIILFLLVSQTASADPFDWIKHHKRFLLIEGAAITAASIHAAGLYHCRRANGAEPCEAHYGAAWASFGALTTMNVVVMPAVAEGCWKNSDSKYCHLFAWSGSAAQAGWGVHEWRVDRPHKKPQGHGEIDDAARRFR